MVITQLYMQVKEILSANPCCDPAFETDCLLEAVLGGKRIALPKTYEVSDAQQEQIIKWAKKRQEGYPLQYILGKWQFFDLELLVGEGVLIPRSDTETVCEAAFEIIQSLPQPHVIDLCSGSGAIALAIKKYCPHAGVVAVEKSSEAFGYLLKNIDHTHLPILPVQGDIFRMEDTFEDDAFDVIISNPPYIDPNLKGTLQKEVEFEPEMALFAPSLGLRFYRFIAEFYKDKLKQGGYLIFEYGYDQQQAVKNILIGNGYTIVKEIIDLGNQPRGVIAKK